MEISIEKILNNYTLNTPELSVRKQARDTIKDVTGVKVPLESISYQKGEIRVDISPLARSHIHIHKDEILNQLEINIKQKQIKDVK